MPRAATARLLVTALAALGSLAAAGAAHGSTGAFVAGLTVSPSPGTPDASATTQISLLGAPVAAVRELRVRGSHTGLHRGRLVPYSSGDGASFLPRHRFRHGEVVSVRITTQIGGKSRRGVFRFRIGRHAGIGVAPGNAPPGSPLGAERFVSRPDLHPPTLKVSTSAAGRSPGALFVAPILGPGQRPPLRGQFGPTIYDDSGQLIWHKQVPRGSEAFNFRVQSYRGAPVLTWWQGKLSFLGFGFGENVVYDSAYRQIARVRAGNGYHADLHEFTLDSRSSGWLTAYVPVTFTAGGRHHRHTIAVLDSVVQRIDVPTGLVMFEWHGLGHIPLHESYVKQPLALPWDAYHVNSIQVHGDGNFLISARNTWAAYEVSGHSGRIFARIGGKHSDYRLGRGARFAWQHDANRQADGTITIFDDEAAPRVGHQSRGITLTLDASHHRASLVHSYTHRRLVVAGSQGNMQVLPGGNVLVGWGARPYISEFSPTGSLLYEASLPRQDESYRAYRFAWTGMPVTKPAAAIRSVRGQPTVYASWNGATQVASWRVLGGGAADALAPLTAAVARAGFETALPVTSPPPFVAVEALDASGRSLGVSQAIKTS
jgi:hypothetical protein